MKLLIVATLAALVLCGSPFVFASQLNWNAKSLDSASTPEYIFQRLVVINYKDGGQLADELRGKHSEIRFSADSTTPGVQELVEKINKNLEQSGSTVRVSDLLLTYHFEILGRQNDAAIDYKITMRPVITGFFLREYSIGSPALFDASWRGIKAEGPVIVSDKQYGDVEINHAISMIEKNLPQTFEKISGTETERLLSSSLIDASGMGKLPISKWHSLFDPTGIQPESTKYGFKGDKVVVTTFAMGESNIMIGRTVEKSTLTSITSDKTYQIQIIDSSDSATISFAGYAVADRINGLEVFGASEKPPPGSAINPLGSFSVFVIYGMAGIAAASATGCFWWSGKKAKKDSHLGQTGISPALLRGVETSAAAGCYKTNRGEAQLISSEHVQTKSVYSKTEGKKGTMPKGWE